MDQGDSRSVTTQISCNDDTEFQFVTMANHLFRRPDRSPNWYFWYVDPTTGKRKHSSCRTINKNEAKRFAYQKLKEIFTKAKSLKLQPILLSKFREDYLESRQGTFSPQTIRTVRDSFVQFQKRLGDKPLNEITVRECELFINTNQPSPFTARKHYAHLKSAFNTALQWGMIENNPFVSFKKPKIIEKSVDYFSEKDFVELYKSLPYYTYAEKRFRNLVCFDFETGMRLGEILSLEWKAIFEITSNVIVQNTTHFTTKSKKNRKVPLTYKALDIIIDQRKCTKAQKNELIKESQYVFPNRKGKPLSESYIEHLFATYCKRLFPGRKLSFHSLRHGYATRLALDGVDVQEMQLALGHSSVNVTQRYTHLGGKDLSAIRQSLNKNYKPEPKDENNIIHLKAS